MADERRPLQDVRVVDLLGTNALDFLPGREDLRQFAEELTAIKTSLNVLNTNFEKSIKANTDLADFYKTGFGEQASRATAEGRVQYNTGGGPSRFDEGAARRVLQQKADQEMNPGGPSRPPDADNRVTDADDYRGRQREKEKDHEPLTMPQLYGGQWTSQNLLEYMSDVTGRFSRREGMADPESKLGQLTAPLLNRVGDDRWERASKLLDKAGSQWAPKMSMFHEFANRMGYDMRPSSLEGAGEITGTPGGTGFGNSIGPSGDFGFRIPFLNPAARKGMAEEFQKWKMSLRPGLNKEQANFIFDQLYERGYTGGVQTNRMRDAGADITQYSKVLGEDPTTYDLMDKVTRWGTTGLKEFVNTIKQVPDAAKKAHVSQQQLLADMNEMGEINQEQGGSHFRGQQTAKFISGSLGMPAQPWLEAFKDPLIQARASLDTGLLPNAQGLMGPGERMASALTALKQTYDAMGPMGDTTRRLPGKAGEMGFTHTYGGEAQRLALVHQIHPEFSEEMLSKVLNPKNFQGLMQSSDVESAARSWSLNVGSAVTHKNKGQIQALLNATAKGKGNYGDLLNLMKGAKTLDSKGRVIPMFGPNDMAAINRAGALGPGLHSDEDIRKAASRRAAMISKVVKRHADDLLPGPNSDGPKLTVELGPAAKRHFHIKVNPSATAKTSALAGGTPVNSAFGGGPSPNPPATDLGAVPTTSSDGSLARVPMPMGAPPVREP